MMLQGSTVVVAPRARGEGGTNEDAVTRKWHEPKVSVPVAVLPPDVTENVGVVVVLVNATVVAAVVPKAGTPFAKLNGVFATPEVVVGDAGATVLVAAACTGALPPPPPPQATRKLVATNKDNRRLRVLFTVGTFRLA